MNSKVTIKKKEVFCPNCGNIGKAKMITKGSILIEIFLWILLIIPGLIYSLWRQTSKYKACAACGNESVIPGTAPNVQKMIANHPAYN